MKESKSKAYAIDPATGLRRINFDRQSGRRFRWDADVPCGVPVPQRWFEEEYEEGGSEN